MSELSQVQGRTFHEDIAFGATLTYATGGNLATLEGAALLERVLSVRFRAFGTTAVVAQAVPGSESGQTFKYRLYEQDGATGGLSELANGATVTTTASTLEADYTGT